MRVALVPANQVQRAVLATQSRSQNLLGATRAVLDAALLHFRVPSQLLSRFAQKPMRGVPVNVGDVLGLAQQMLVVGVLH